MHFLCNLSGVFLNNLYILLGNMSGRNDTCGVTGVNTCQLNMLHNGRHERMGAIADCICLTLHGMI